MASYVVVLVLWVAALVGALAYGLELLIGGSL